MATRAVLKIQPRTEAGKGAARTLRRAGLVPGVIYGEGFETSSVAIDTKSVEQVWRQAGSHEILRLEAVGETDGFEAIIKELQIDPVSRRAIHIDLLRIRADKELDVRIPLILQGTPKGVKEFGGILQTGFRDLEITCLPKDLPESITVDVSNLMIHDSIHVKDLTLPDGVTVLMNPEEVVATVLPPATLKLEAELEAPVTASPQAEKEKAEGGKPEGGKAEGQKAGAGKTPAGKGAAEPAAKGKKGKD
jgi:large subunit ribosomal protein L25